MDLLQAAYSFTLTSSKAEVVLVSPRFWSGESGNLLFVLIFPIVYILAKARQLYFVCCSDHKEELNAKKYEEEDGEAPGDCCGSVAHYYSCVTNRMNWIYHHGHCFGRSMAQFVSAAFMAYDIYADYEYLITVPIYGNVLHGLLITSLALPLLLSMCVGIVFVD